MNPSSAEEARRWLAQAGKDMDAADVLAKAGHYNLTCFLAQQAAEKASKAFLYSQGAEEVWGHSVARLVEEAASFDESLRPLAVTGALLDKFYVPTRYPNGLPGGIPSAAYSEEEARRAMGWAESIICAVGSRVGRPAAPR